jgi:lantibiotic leader peptide-processing serine protease
MRPGQVEQYLTQTAIPQDCSPNPFLFPDFPQTSGEPQECQGGLGYNGFHGHGEVDALKAIFHDTSNNP